MFCQRRAVCDLTLKSMQFALACWFVASGRRATGRQWDALLIIDGMPFVWFVKWTRNLINWKKSSLKIGKFSLARQCGCDNDMLMRMWRRWTSRWRQSHDDTTHPVELQISTRRTSVPIKYRWHRSAHSTMWKRQAIACSTHLRVTPRRHHPTQSSRHPLTGRWLI